MNTKVEEKPLSKKAQKELDQKQAITQLLELIKPSDEVYTILRRVSSSGMTRHISVLIPVIGTNEWDKGKIGIFDITWLCARAMDHKMDRDTGGLVVGGCGMDMGFHVVYSLARTLWRDNFFCAGENCPANDHTNAYSNEHNGQCIVCRKETKDSKYTRTSRGNLYKVCSVRCSLGEWKHSDTGYALKQRWL